MRTLIMIVILLPALASGQIQNKRMTDLINQIYQSDSSNFTFELKQIPAEIISRILSVNDSLYHVLYKKKKRTTLKKFMADTYGDWNATDVIINDKLPRRQFIYAVNLNTKWVLTYDHGGRGSHYHIIYVDTKTLDKLTTAVTNINFTQIEKLRFDKRVYEIKDRPFKTIINEGQFKMLNGELIENYDVF